MRTLLTDLAATHAFKTAKVSSTAGWTSSLSSLELFFGKGLITWITYWASLTGLKKSSTVIVTYSFQIQKYILVLITHPVKVWDDISVDLYREFQDDKIMQDIDRVFLYGCTANETIPKQVLIHIQKRIVNNNNSIFV